VAGITKLLEQPEQPVIVAVVLPSLTEKRSSAAGGFPCSSSTVSPEKVRAQRAELKTVNEAKSEFSPKMFSVSVGWLPRKFTWVNELRRKA